MVDLLTARESRFQPATPPLRLAGPRLAQTDAGGGSAEVSSAVRDLAVEISLRAARLRDEVALAENPEMRRGIPLIGQEFSEGETLQMFALVALALGEITDSALNGPLASYVSASTRASLEESRAALNGVERFVASARTQVREGHEGLAEEYLSAYVGDVRELRDAAERLLVSVETPADGAVPVKERGEEERQGATGVLWAIGALIASGVAVYFLAGE